MIETRQLLADYVRNGTESAFREIVSRHVNLVYSTALRIVRGDSLLAEDVSQMVFIDLARKAGRLPVEVPLGGWLHRHTCFTAAKALRGEIRRVNRERQAMEMKSINEAPDALLVEMGPILDEAINELETPERLAIILRFFEQHDFRAVGLGLGISEDAARMRVNRTLEKLRGALAKRGVACPATALGNALTLHAVMPAPAGMAAALSANALVATAGAGAGGGLAAMVLRYLAGAKMQIALGSALGAFVVVLAVYSLMNPVRPTILVQRQPTDMTPEAPAAKTTPSTFERIQAQLAESARQPAAEAAPPASANLVTTAGAIAAPLELYATLAKRTVLHGSLTMLPAKLSELMLADPSKATAVFVRELQVSGYAVVMDGEKFAQIMPLGDTNKPRAKPPRCNPAFEAKPRAATNEVDFPGMDFSTYLNIYASLMKRTILRSSQLQAPPLQLTSESPLTQDELVYAMGVVLHLNGVEMVADGDKFAQAVPVAQAGSARTNAPKTSAKEKLYSPGDVKLRGVDSLGDFIGYYAELSGLRFLSSTTLVPTIRFKPETSLTKDEILYGMEKTLNLSGMALLRVDERSFRIELSPGSRGFGGFGGRANGPPSPTPTPGSSIPAR